MAALLYRLGRFSFRHKWSVAGLWAVVIGLVLAAASAFSGPLSSAFTLPGTESQRAMDALDREFPSANGALGVVALRAGPGTTLAAPAAQADVAAVAQAAGAIDGVVGVGSPYDSGAVSADGRTAILTVQFGVPNPELTDDARADYLALGDLGTATDLRVAPGGSPTSEPVEVSGSEGIGVLVALAVLVLTLGSLVAAGMTLLNALIGVAVGMLGITAVSGSVELSSTAPILALMIGLAVGIDYALFISSRYRALLVAGTEPAEAAGRAVATAGSAVVFAGLTVVIALAALAVVGIPFIGVMGLAAAGTVAVAVLVSLSLLPAILGLAGSRVLPRRVRRRTAAESVPADPEAAPRPMGLRWVTFVVRHRAPVLVAGLLTLVVLALPVGSMRLAMPDDGTAPAGSSSRQAFDLITDGFGAGYNARLVLVTTAPTAQEAAELSAAAAERIAGLADVVAVLPGAASPDGTTVLLGVLPAGGPSSESTQQVVHDIRAAVEDLPTTAAQSLDLTGLTAVGVDLSERLAAALPLYLAIVVGLSLLLLLVAFRSVLVPVKATVGFLLSVAATFGVTVAVFQWGWLSGLVGVDTASPIPSLLPILMIGILFGLAMDYEVFLVSRMQEEHLAGADAQVATVRGVQHGARVVTAAALIMISIFAGFVLIDDPILRTIGFALALGVLIDAFVVRMTLVPAVMSLLGDRAWVLPTWLGRILPRVDLEGAAIGGRIDP